MGEHRRVGAFEQLEARQMMTGNTYTVTTLEDIAVAGTTTDTAYSIREALTAAASHSGADTVNFAESIVGGVIRLDSSLGQLSVSSDVAIVGPGQDLLTIDAQRNSRVFYVGPGTAVTISGMTITGGGGVTEGGGVLSYGNLTIDEVTVVDNEVGGYIWASGGGISSLNYYGIYADAQLHLNNSTVDGNRAYYGGGVRVQVESSGVLEISGSTISNNVALDSSNDGLGGGLWLSVQSGGAASIANTTFSGNASHAGGAMMLYGTSLAITNSTISNNHADVTGGYAGGIENSNSVVVTMHNSILAGNSATHGTYKDQYGSVGGTTLVPSTNNILGIQHTSVSTSSADHSDLLNGVNGNQVGNQTTPRDPGLMPLADYGGTTWTHALKYDSYAIDAGSNAAAASLASDQRGYNRKVSRHTSTHTVDIGAYELGLVVSTNADEQDTTYTYGDLSLREALYLSGYISGTNQIEFAPELLTGETIELSLGQLTIGSSVDIVGLGRADLTIDGNGASRVFNITTGDITLRKMTITGGAGVDEGGGIYNVANLTLDSVRVSGNRTNMSIYAGGGGIYSGYGSLRIHDSSIDNNITHYGGGLKIYIDQSTDVVEITGSVIYDNTAFDESDDSGEAGAVFLQSASGATGVVFANSTVSGNRSNHSGGVRLVSGIARIVNSTITANHAAAGLEAAQGGGIVVLTGATLYLENSIVADNEADSAFDDIANYGTVDSSSSSNLVGEISSSTLNSGTNQIIGASGDPGLLPLGDYGGPTLTHALKPNSSAINAGDGSSVFGAGGTAILFDQRGILNARRRGSGVDIGAFEANVVQASGALTIYGTEGDDEVYANLASSSMSDTGLPDLASREVTFNGSAYVVPSTITSTTIYGFGGDDLIRAFSSSGSGATIYGGDGDDRIVGSEKNDAIYGDFGNDVIDAGTLGVDSLAGGAGLDQLLGTSNDSPTWVGSATQSQSQVNTGDTVTVTLTNATGNPVAWRVDWGDGSSSDVTTSSASYAHQHTYSQGGKFALKVWQIVSADDLLRVPLGGVSTLVVKTTQLATPINLRVEDVDPGSGVDYKISWTHVSDFTGLSPAQSLSVTLQYSTDGLTWLPLTSNWTGGPYGIGAFKQIYYFRIAANRIVGGVVTATSEFSAPLRYVHDYANGGARPDEWALPVTALSSDVGTTAEVTLSFANDLFVQSNLDNLSYTIFRRPNASSSWSMVANGLQASQIETPSGQVWTDRSPTLEHNATYEYKIVRNGSNGKSTGYIVGSTERSSVAQEGKGTVALIIDDRFEDSLAFEIATLTQDLIGDGWRVETLVRHVHATDLGDTNALTAEQLRDEIIALEDDLDETSPLRSVLLLGHIPVPESGWLAPDNHFDRSSPLPADVFYGDIDGIWDDLEDNSLSDGSLTENKLGDYRYDEAVVPTDGSGGPLELSVGRIDMYNMTNFDPLTEYTGGGSPQSYTIPVGQHYTGEFEYLAFAFGQLRDSSASSATGKFSNIVLHNGSDSLSIDPTTLTFGNARDIGGRLRFGGDSNQGSHSQTSTSVTFTGSNWQVTSVPGSTPTSSVYNSTTDKFIIGPNSYLTFTYESSSAPQIAAIGFDKENVGSGKEQISDDFLFRVESDDRFGWGKPIDPELETALLARYLAKDHAFRHGEFDVDRRAFVNDTYAAGGSAFGNVTSLFGDSNTDVYKAINGAGVTWEGGYLEDHAYMWVNQLSAASDGALWQSGNIRSRQFRDEQSLAVFANVRSSFTVGWDRTDGLLRSVLANDGYGLVSIWGDSIAAYEMGVGASIGDVLLTTHNFGSDFGYEGEGVYSWMNPGTFVNIMGDPTLRLHVVKPPKDLTATNAGGGVDLEWDAPVGETILGYNVYRTTVGSDDYQRINTELVTGTTYHDGAGSPTSSTYLYMVRAEKLEITPSGAYHNLSQGAFSRGVELIAAISAGGEDPETSHGVPFEIDDGETYLTESGEDGATWSVDDAIDLAMATWGAKEDLFQSARLGGTSADKMQWDFGVVSGTYAVRLAFAEIDSLVSVPGERTFNFSVEGNNVYDFDIVAEAGGNFRGIMRTFVVDVLDGNLDIDFWDDDDFPLVSAIEVHRIS